MACLNFHTKNGKTYKTQVENRSIMEAAVDANIPQIEGACGGSLACATCHIHLSDTDFARIQQAYPLSEEEADMLELAENRQKTSRLSCQILIKPGDPDLDVFLP